MNKKHVNIKWMSDRGLQEVSPGVWGIPSKTTNGGQEGALKQAQEPVMHDKPVRINIKPLSVNAVYQGRRFRHKDYDVYENKIRALLPKIKIPNAPYHLYFKFCFSTTNADCSNPIKPIEDILQKFYNFNDRNVYKLTVEKWLAPKGQEYFEFMILPYEPEVINK